MKKLVATLVNGSASGKPFNRMSSWEAFIGGALIIALAFSCLFIGL